MLKLRTLFLLSVVLCVGSTVFLQAQFGTNHGEWRVNGGDTRSSRYSPLDQINAANVKQLQIAWSWAGQNMGPRADTNWEVTPLMVGGVLYFTAGIRRNVVAIDAASGETLWLYRLDDSARGAVRTVNRGLSYWSDGRGDDRVVVISPGYQLLALDAKTGRPISGFGNNGLVDLWLSLDRPSVKPGTIGATSPAIIVKDVVIVGAALEPGVAPKSKENVPGYIRGYDVRTGKLLWTFRTIPQAGEFGNNTWENDAWKYTGNTGAWGPLSADEDLGYVYIPVEAPTGDIYGGHRPGANLFGDSLVCLDARTGKRIWHFQLIHHDIWDYDPPAAPVLLDVTVNGKRIKAVAQVTKQAFTYVFDRVTGQPVWPIEERPVPQTDVPGEKTSATQPFPTKPLPFDRQGLTLDDLADYTPEVKAEAIKIASQFKIGPLFTPPIVYDSNNGKKGLLKVPGSGGGSNWQGAGADLETGILYVPSVTSPIVSALVRADPKRSDMDYVLRAGSIDRPMGLPLVKPPWGRITAIDLNTGDHLWMIANGETPADVKNNPALKGVDIGTLGWTQRAPVLITKTLLFAGGGKTFRALDKKTGQVMGDFKLPGNDTGGPMTYVMNGRQFIVVAIGGAGNPVELVALSLPEPGRAPRQRPASDDQ